MRNVPGEAPPYEANIGGNSQGHWVHLSPCPLGGGLGNKPGIAGGGCLSLSQTIYLVIVHYVGHIHVAIHSVDEMVPSFPIAVAVTANSDDGKGGIGYLGAGGSGESPPVKLVENMTPSVMRELSRLPYARYHQYPVGLDIEGY